MYKKFATIFQYSSEIYSVRTYKSLSLILVFPVDDVSAEVFVRDLDSQGSCWNAWNFARDLESQNICRSTWWSFTLFYSTYSFFEHATHHNFAQFYLLSYLLICRLLPILLGHSSSSRSTTFRFADPRWTPSFCHFHVSAITCCVFCHSSAISVWRSTVDLCPVSTRISPIFSSAWKPYRSSTFRREHTFVFIPVLAHAVFCALHYLIIHIPVQFYHEFTFALLKAYILNIYGITNDLFSFAIYLFMRSSTFIIFPWHTLR